MSRNCFHQWIVLEFVDLDIKVCERCGCENWPGKIDGVPNPRGKIDPDDPRFTLAKEDRNYR